MIENQKLSAVTLKKDRAINHVLHQYLKAYGH